MINDKLKETILKDKIENKIDLKKIININSKINKLKKLIITQNKT